MKSTLTPFLLLFKKFLTDINYEHIVQVNDKGQLWLSRRALLPNTNPENVSVNQHTSDSKDTLASQQTPHKGSPKKMPTVAKGDVSEENNKQPENSTGSPRSNSAENILVPQKKFIRRLVSPGRDGSHTSKEKAKKSSSKAVRSVSFQDQTSLVNGEGNNG